MSSGRYLLHQAIGGVFLPRSPVPHGFWRPDLVLHSHIVFACCTYFWLAGWWLAALAGLGWLGWLAGWLADWLVPGWWLAGWLAGGLAGWLAGWAWLAGWLAWLAGCWLAGWLAGWLAVYIIWLWMAGIWWMWAPRFYGHESDLVLTSYWTSYLYCPWICICCIGYIYQRKTMNIKCLPRIRGVPTSFYKLNMMFSTNQGTPQDYSSLHQIKAVAHIHMYLR